ncbi:MAG: HDIG domain-containing protein [Planctomycetota bacterium]|nr:MAG: HDIG domain-containing protein [Planctomycetota bacterium]REJ93103.1 MAG: HDIG domain-containing protein [Planctomycetota bacterium]REK30091.1 MAG: HDIG domain-containing protein [Planctomycetota bacterium]REK37667.1 MAG: HDIG domain-containing protein [Planctomycetota bacterium]
MFNTPPKRSRKSRSAGLRAPETVWSKLAHRLRDRGTLLRLSLCLIALVMFLVLVKSWRTPFPFRAGQRVPHGVAAKIPFERIDEQATAELREQADREVPFVFRNNPSRLDPLPQQLRAALGEVSQSTSIDDLTPAVAKGFGLAPRETSAGNENPFAAADPLQRYTELKQALGPMDTTSPRQRIDDIYEDFSKFISPLRRIGLIDPKDAQLDGLDADRRIRIVGAEAVADETEIFLPQVRIADRLNDAGDLGKSWLSYPSLTESLQPALSHWLVVNAPATLQFDQNATTELRSAARDAVPVQKQQFIEGDLLVQPGAVITEKSLQLLRDEYEAVEARIGPTERLTRIAVVFLLISVLAVLNGYYIVHNEPRLVKSVSRLIVYLLIIVGSAALARLLSFFPMPAEVVPLIAVAMLLTISYDQVLATLSALTLCIVVTLSTTFELSQFIVLMSVAAISVIPLSRVASRKKIVIVGFYAALTYFFVRMGLGIIEAQSLNEVTRDMTLLIESAQGAGLCLAAAYIVAANLPFVESAFGVVTDISLLELSDPSHPLLQELVRRAPGTYNHSITMGSIAESAAESIGANGLLVRVGAYFHDIGKMLKPQYFIENLEEGGENRHQHLAPAMSTLIIVGHVKDGMDLAEQYNLPQVIIDFIEQHHGTTLVEYFFHEATRQAEGQPDHRTDAEESSFRYPGPKPQTREAGVMMLADAVESASRALSDPTPKRIESLVNGITLKRLLDGQFDESSLTLSEIRTVEDSLIKSLIANYHGRIRYPDVKVQTA